MEKMYETEKLNQLFTLIKEFSALKPWSWFLNDEVVGIRFEATDETYFMIVLGNADTIYGLSIYKESDGFKTIRYMQEDRYELPHEATTMINGYVIMLEDRLEIFSEDKELIDQSGVKFRGKKQWPMIRVLEMGRCPEDIDQENIEELCGILKIMNPLLSMMKQEKRYPVNRETQEILIRTVDKHQHIEDNYESMEKLLGIGQPVEINIIYDALAVKRLIKATKQDRSIWEMDAFHFPSLVENGLETYYPVGYLVVEQESEGTVDLKVADSYYEEEIQLHFIEMLTQLGYRPAKIIIRDNPYLVYLYPLIEELGIKLSIGSDYTVLKAVKKEFVQSLDRMDDYTDEMDGYPDEIDDWDEEIFDEFLDEEELYKEQYLIKGPVSYSLKSIMAKLTKDKLRRIAEYRGIVVQKKALVKDMRQSVLASYEDTTCMDVMFSLMRPKSKALLSQLLEQCHVINSGFELEEYYLLLETGLVFLYSIEGHEIFVMPEEVQKYYKNMDLEELALRQSTIDVVEVFCRAAVNLYGVITGSRIHEIICHYELFEENEHSFERMERLLDVINLRTEYFQYKSEMLYGEYFQYEDAEGLINEILINDKPYYMPEIGRFLEYSNDFYFEPSSGYNKMKTYIQKYVTQDLEQIEMILRELKYTHMFGKMDEVFDIFANYGFILKSEKDIGKAMEAYVAFANDQRLWVNHGFTPNELSRATIRTEKKVGRNDPCPCGSGKKYKHCCLQ